MRILLSGFTVVLLGGCGAPVPTTAPKSLLQPVSLEAHSNSAWADGNDLYEKAQGGRGWSPYTWASNAAALPSLKDDPARRARTVEELLKELRSHTEDSGGMLRIRYDYNYFFDQYTIETPWYSAFGNAAAAIGLMHIYSLTPTPAMKDLIERYLDAIGNGLSFNDGNGNIWFSEYIAKGLPNGHVDVMNGHFFSVIAMYEWRSRTSTKRYDKNITDGLDTMEKALPEMIQDGYFSYARGFPNIKDYGQQRAVNFAVAACKLRTTVCPITVQYQDLFYRQWAGK